MHNKSFMILFIGLTTVQNKLEEIQLGYTNFCKIQAHKDWTGTEMYAIA